MSIGTNIKGIREDKKLTQEQVADALDVSFQAVSSWERDEYKPDLDNLIKLAEIFDVSISAIAEEKKNPFKTKDAIYNWEHMKTYVKTTARNFKLQDTLKAIDFAVNAHEGQKRKRSVVPYIYHPLNLACHALSMGLTDDKLIAANSKASLVKCIDRCNNLTTMSWGLSRDRIYRMINETEKYYPRLIKVIKSEAEYSNAAWLLQYQMESMLDIYKRLL